MRGVYLRGVFIPEVTTEIEQCHTMGGITIPTYKTMFKEMCNNIRTIMFLNTKTLEYCIGTYEGSNGNIPLCEFKSHMYQDVVDEWKRMGLKLIK